MGGEDRAGGVGVGGLDRPGGGKPCIGLDGGSGALDGAERGSGEALTTGPIWNVHPVLIKHYPRGGHGWFVYPEGEHP